MSTRTRRSRETRHESPEEAASSAASSGAFATTDLPDRTQEDDIDSNQNANDEGGQEGNEREHIGSPAGLEDDQLNGDHRSSPSPRRAHSPTCSTRPSSRSPLERSPHRPSPSPSQQLRSQSPLEFSPTRKPRSRSSARPESVHESPPPALQRPRRLHYRHVCDLPSSSHPFSTVKISPSGRLLAAGSSSGSIYIYDVLTMALEHVLEGHLAGVSVIAWSSDGKTLASGSDDKSIRLWSAVTGKPLREPLMGHHNYVVSLAWTPKGNILVSGSFDEAVFLWDVRGRRIMKSLPAHSDPVYGVDVVRDGTLVCSCSSDGLTRIWDTATGQCLRTLVHEDNAPVTSVRFSPNGRYVLAWTLDSSIRLWDYGERRRCSKTYQGHTNQKFSLTGSFGIYGPPPTSAVKSSTAVNGHAGGETNDLTSEGSPRPRYARPFAFIVSGSEDGSIFFWDVGSKEILQRLDGHQGPVFGVDAHPTEPLIVSCGMDGKVKIWRDDGFPEKDDEGNGVQDDVDMKDFDGDANPSIKSES